MKLRNFLYINTKLLDDYIAAIDGYVYEEETQTINETNQKSGGTRAGIPIISGEAKIEVQSVEGTQRKVRISESAKFEKIYKFLSSNEEAKLKYYEFLSEEYFNNLYRDDFLEVLVTARFSKTKELSDTMKKLNSLAGFFEDVTEQKILDKKTKEALHGLSTLSDLKSGKEISCVFSFNDNKYPIISYLDEDYFKCSQEQFIGEFYMLCKIQRKIPKGQTIQLDEIFEDFKKIPLNRAQRRNLPKNMDNPEIIRDIIEGPAIQVIPIAIYQ